MAINRVVRKAHDQPLDNEVLEQNCTGGQTPLEFSTREHDEQRAEQQFQARAWLVPRSERSQQAAQCLDGQLTQGN